MQVPSVAGPACTKPCSESLPPCLMTDSDFVFDPSAVGACKTSKI